jgi:DNA-binding transcriptional ArsR family regulator
MKNQFLIEDMETLRVFADPTRIAILQMLREPRSVREVAGALDVPRTRLYHHVNLMEEKGLIEVAEVRKTGRLPEKLYRCAAHGYTVSDHLAETDDVSEQFEVMVSAIFDVTKADLQRAVAARLLTLDLRERVGLSRQLVRIAPDRAAEFVARLEALVEELEATESTADDAIAYAFTWAFYPTSYPTGGTT